MARIIRSTMKIMDRYLLRSYLVPLAYCLLAFCMIYVVVDLFYNFNEFLEANLPISRVILYYAAFLPSANGPCSFLLLIIPISLLVGALSALSRLTHHNELTALRASGIGLVRLMCPFLAVGLCCVLVTGLIQEFVTPVTSYWSAQFLKRLKDGAPTQGGNAIPILTYRNRMAFRDWIIMDYDVRNPNLLRNVTVVQQRPDGSIEEDIHAKEAEWLDGRWWFFSVRSRAYNANGSPRKRHDAQGNLLHCEGPLVDRREMRDFKETPDDFLSEVKDPQYLSSFELNKFLRTHGKLSKQKVAALRVDMHVRLAMPWTCLLVTLVGFPAGAQTGKHGVLTGVLLALGLFFLYYALVYLGVGLGKAQVLTPWLAAWAPNVIFLFVGLTMGYRMEGS